MQIIYKQGAVCYIVKKYDDALWHYNKGLEYDPENIALLVNRAYLNLVMGRHSQVIEDCAKLLPLVKFRSDIETMLYCEGMAFHKLNRVDDAFVDLEVLREIFPESGKVYILNFIYH